MAVDQQERIRVAGKAKRIIMVAAAIATIVATVFVVLGAVLGVDAPFTVYFCDAEGFPRTDLAITLPDGSTAFTRDRGKLVFPASYAGKCIDIYLVEPWRWLMSVPVIRRDGEQTVRIVVPREGSGAAGHAPD